MGKTQNREMRDNCLRTDFSPLSRVCVYVCVENLGDPTQCYQWKLLALDVQSVEVYSCGLRWVYFELILVKHLKVQIIFCLCFI